VLEGNHGLAMFYAEKDARVPIKWAIGLYYIFLLRKWLMKAIVSIPGAVESS
jgi:hypothetical protein